MPTTFVHGLLPAACLRAAGQKLSLSRAQWARFLLIAFVLGNSPDLDVIPASLFPSQWKAIHREWGHNIFALALWSYLGVFAIRTWVSRDIRPRLAWLISSSLVVSHVVLDALGGTVPGHVGGVPLFWPISSWHLALPYTPLPPVVLDPKVHPLLANLIASNYWTHVIYLEAGYSLLIFGLWITGLGALRGLKRVAEKIRRLPEARVSADPERS